MPAQAPLIPPPELDFDSRDPWAEDTMMIIPIESTQVLMPEQAAILGVHAFLKMTHLSYTVKEVSNAIYISPNGKLPVLKSGPYVISEISEIVQLAQSKGISLTENLSIQEKADLRAYLSLVNNVLGNALLYFTWLDPEVYNNLTKHRVGSPYNFPLNYLVPWTEKRKVKSQLSALKWAQKDPSDGYKEVETCLLALSERLGSSDYYFGSSPTELDAVVFGYLFTMITMRLGSSNVLGNLVRQQSNLVRFCQRLERDYFSDGRPREQGASGDDPTN